MLYAVNLLPLRCMVVVAVPRASDVAVICAHKESAATRQDVIVLEDGGQLTLSGCSRQCRDTAMA